MKGSLQLLLAAVCVAVIGWQASEVNHIAEPSKKVEAATSQPAGDDSQPLFVEVDVPDQVDPYELVIVAVDTNAQHSRVRVRRSLFETVDVHRLRVDGTYGWVGPPGEYLVEVDVFDSARGIDGKLRKVTIGDPPKPDPPPGPDPPPPPPGDPTWASLVPTWLATVPADSRSDIPAMQTAMREIADDHAKFDAIGHMRTGLGIKLQAAITKPGWGSFGDAMSGELNRRIESGQIDTTAKVATALRQIAEAM